MSYKQLFYFVTIVEAGNISAAAKKLNLSQPPLSKQIMLLENELGVKLMERSSRKITLTDAGYLLFQRAKNIISMMESTSEEMALFESARPHVLRLGVISSCSRSIIQDCMTDFYRLYPHVRFEISEANTYNILEMLNRGVIEAAVVRTPFHTDGLECMYGPEEPLVAVGNESYLGKSGVPITISQLAEIPIDFYRRFEHILIPVFQNNGVKPNIFCESDDARTPLMWARAGLGVAVVPKSISKLVERDTLSIRMIVCKELVTKTAAVYKKGGFISEIGKTFVNFWAEKMQLAANK